MAIKANRVEMMFLANREVLLTTVDSMSQSYKNTFEYTINKIP